MVVNTLLLVVKHSTTLIVVTGLVVVVSLTVDTILLGCDTTEMFCCLGDEQLSITVEDCFGTIWIKPIQKTLHQIMFNMIILIYRCLATVSTWLHT